jgi:hypothetical protein
MSSRKHDTGGHKRCFLKKQSEWQWTTTGLDMTGVIIMGVEEERIVWARLNMEPVEKDGQGIDEAMNTITEGASWEGDVSLEEASPT